MGNFKSTYLSEDTCSTSCAFIMAGVILCPIAFTCNIHDALPANQKTYKLLHKTYFYVSVF